MVAKKTQKKPKMPNTPKMPRGQKKVFMFRFNLKKLLIWGLIIFLFVPGLAAFFGGELTEDITVSQAMQDIADEKVQQIEILGDTVLLQYDETTYKTFSKEEGESFGEIVERYELDPAEVDYAVRGAGFMENIGD